jgi:hypothetical protein
MLPAAAVPVWGEDGGIIATLSSSTGVGLSRISDSGGAPRALTTPGDRGEASDRWPQILPGGEEVLFTATTNVGDYDNGRLQVLSLKTEPVKVIARPFLQAGAENPSSHPLPIAEPGIGRER